MCCAPVYSVSAHGVSARVQMIVHYSVIVISPVSRLSQFYTVLELHMRTYIDEQDEYEYVLNTVHALYSTVGKWAPPQDC